MEYRNRILVSNKIAIDQEKKAPLISQSSSLVNLGPERYESASFRACLSVTSGLIPEPQFEHGLKLAIFALMGFPTLIL